MSAPALKETIGRALGRGADARYVALFVAGMLAPAALAYLPVSSFFQTLFDSSTRGKEMVAALDSRALLEVLRQLGEPAGGPTIQTGILSAVLVSAFIAPVLAGAALIVARKSGPLTFGALLGGAGETYLRMVRTAIASCIPLGVAAGGAALAYSVAGKSAAKAVTEAAGSRVKLLALLVSITLFWLANVTVEAGRAHFGADPARRSALGAWWSGVRLLARRPAQVLGLSLATTLVGVGGAFVVTGLRFRITQSGGVSIAIAFVLAQLAVAALAWGRSARLAGLVAVIRAEDEV